MSKTYQNQTSPTTTAPNCSTKKQFQVALLSQHQIVLSAQDIFSARPAMGRGYGGAWRCQGTGFKSRWIVPKVTWITSTASINSAM